VGSKAIETVLPDVLASTGPMRNAVRALLSALGPGVGDATVLEGLEEFMLRRVDELESELGGLVSEPLRTPSRLGLDRLLGRLSAELDAAQALLELLEVASVEPFVSLRPPEVLRERLPATPSGKRPRRRREARLTVEEPAPEIGIRPRALAALVGTLVELVCDEADEPGIVVRPGGAGVEVLVNKRATLPADSITFWAYGVIDPTAATAIAAARLSGLVLESGADTMRLELPLGR
jgi:hypothetical protein